MRAGGLIIAGLMLGAALPALADDLKPICPDRPGHATSACTVEAGHVQVEAALYDGYYQRRSGVTTDFTVAASPVVKYGLSDSVDIEAGMPLYQELRIHGPSGTTHQGGIGDLTLHVKWNPLAGDDGPFAAVVAPYLKLPTAGGGLSNGAVEGGLLLPLAYTLGDGWSLFMTPEADDLLNGSGSGMHLQLANDVAIGYSFDGGLTLGADVFMTQSYDPGTKVNQALFDANAAYLTDSNTQLDAGFAVGLNRATPDMEIYCGISRRF